MRICIFGAGSLGSALGGILASSNQVTLIGRRQHMAAVRRDGLTLTGDLRRRVRVEAYENVDGVQPPELLLITTKAFDTEEAVRECRGLVGRNAMVLTLQNGLGNLEMLRLWRGSNAFGGTTTLGACLLAPGKVRISGLGQTLVGADINPAGAGRICRAFQGSGLPTRTGLDVEAAIWRKVAVSASINPLTAVLRVENGKLVESQPVSHMMDDVCREAVSVAVANGVAINSVSSVRLVHTVARNTAGNRSSMLQDVERDRRTEIDQINGAIWRLGEKLGVQTPLNKALWAMVSSLDRASSSQKA